MIVGLPRLVSVSVISGDAAFVIGTTELEAADVSIIRKDLKKKVLSIKGKIPTVIEKRLTEAVQALP